MKRFLLFLAGVFALLPCLSEAQVYRVEHLPAFVSARGYHWNAAKREADYSKPVELPNGAEVRLIDTLNRYDAVVVFEGKKVRMAGRDLVWAADRNKEGARDKLDGLHTLAGVGHYPLHSDIGRRLYSYDAAWLLFLLLALITIVAWLRLVPAVVRIFFLTTGLILVSLVETGWGLLLANDVDWLSDYKDLGMLRTFCQVFGFFALVGWQVLLVKQTQRLICDKADADPEDVRLRWAVLTPIPVFAVAIIVIAFAARGADAGDWAVYGVVAAVAALELFFIVRYYIRLGALWGTAYLLLYLAILVSTVVLVPLTFMLGLFVVGVLVAVVAVFAAIMWLLGDHVEKIGGDYYKVPNFPL